MFKQILHKAKRWVGKHQEMISYLFFGGCAFLVSMGSFYVTNVIFQTPALLANIISWILAVVFAFFTNKQWVFHASAGTTIDAMKQMASFFAGRVMTLAVEEGIIFLFVTILNLNSIAVKLVAQVVVIVLNYLISKYFIFKNPNPRKYKCKGRL